MRTGQINVQTENIFPIIKKFLYSDHEIFLRELVSNAVDASQKLKVLSTNGEFKGELGELKVDVILDKEAKTLTIRDCGIGMTADEIDKYINQIAFSGAEEFVQQYKGKEGAEQIIGHFGLGFYSAFMVAEKVQIQTLSRHDGAQAVQWESNGSTEYTISDIEKEGRGTDIILYISEESAEFLEKSKISDILTKYCKFLSIPVFFGNKTEYIDSPEGEKDENGNVKRVAVDIPNQINNPQPAWTKAPVDLKQEDYDAFYRELYPMTFESPLFHIHLNVDYPFNLTGILYFPKIKENVEVQRNKINLYSNQVFITDSVAEIVPEFLTLLHGVIDSPDIPLNVSRSYLQSDGNVKKISAHITKKVADKLAEMFKKDRKDFEEKWKDLQIFVQYGSLSEDKFAEKSKSFSLLKNTEGGYFTPEEYKEYYEEQTPIFKNIEINEKDIGDYTRNQLKIRDQKYKKGKKLIGSYKGEKIVLMSPQIKWYLQQEHPLKITKVHMGVAYDNHESFTSFVNDVSNARRDAEIDPTLEIIGETMKLFGNSAYGKVITNILSHGKVSYATRNTVYNYINHPSFKDLEELNNDTFEITTSLKTVKANLPLQIGAAVYCYAKLRMLQFYYEFIDKYVDRSDYQLIEQDTDSNYFALTGELDDIIKPELREEYEKDKYNFLPST